jgi:tRNA 2-thiouridine synthesizing protein A
VSLPPDDPAPAAAERPALLLDITTDTCPMTFVRTRLALDRLAPGEILAVRMKGQEPERNVARTSAAQGHIVLSQTRDDDGVTLLLLRRGFAARI